MATGSQEGGIIMFVWKARYTAAMILFLTWFLYYIERMVIAIALPYIAIDFNLSAVAMGGVISAFFAGYSIFQFLGGIIADKFGPRKVMTFGLVWWSIFTAITGFVSSLSSLIAVRFVFGIGEGVFPPASWKSIASWFPKKDRGTANAFMMASSAFGPAIAPLIAVKIMAAWGWRPVYYIAFIPGLLIAAWIWWGLPDDPSKKKGITRQELAEINNGETDQSISEAKKLGIVEVLKVSAVWQCFLILFFYNMAMWGFLSWLPSYLVQARGFSMAQMGIAASLPFLAATVGLLLGGWLSDNVFMNNRKMPIIVFLILGGACLYLTYIAETTQMVIICQTLAGGLMFMGGGAFWAVPMTLLSKEVCGRGMGLINTAGQLAGLLSPIIMGYLISASDGSFYSAFLFLVGNCVTAAIFASMLKRRKDGENTNCRECP